MYNENRNVKEEVKERSQQRERRRSIRGHPETLSSALGAKFKLKYLACPRQGLPTLFPRFSFFSTSASLAISLCCDLAMSDDEYEIPLQDQCVFGAGIKRKGVRFVPATESSSSASLPPAKSSGQSVQDFYLSLVLPQKTSTISKASSATKDTSADSEHTGNDHDPEQSEHVCQVCHLPLSSSITSSEHDATTTNHDPRSRPHEASLAHQVCLTHSHPPSHLDRNRKGLTYLSNFGWNPDSRLGLGKEGQGIQFPIKTKPKDDKLGIGVVLPKEADRRKKEKVEKLDAGKVRKMQEKDKQKTQRLQEMFYRNDDVERYLGGG